MKLKQKSLLVMMMATSLLVGCVDEKKSSAAQTYPVSVSMGAFTTVKFNPVNWIIPQAYAAVSELKFCFKRLRFKRDLEDTVAHETAEDNVDLNLGEYVVSSSGTILADVNVPAGTYKRVEFDLEADCKANETANSASLANDYGTFSSTDRITIKFDGNFIVDGSESLELGVQNILDAANSYDGMGGQSLKEALEAVSGEL